MVGDILRKRREELGQDLLEISKTLKIRYDYLKSIEDEAFEKLPEEVYIKGYIREYAESLDIDPEVAIKAYIQQVLPQNENKELPETGGTAEVTPKKKLKAMYILVSALTVVLITIAFILFFSPKKKPETFPPHVEIKKEVSPLYNKTIIPRSDINGNENNPPSSSFTKRENGNFSEQTKKENILKPERPLHVLEVFATDATWLSVNIDNIDSKEMLLKPGASVKLQAKNAFSLKIGNAGGVKLILDGKEIGTLGEKGQVIKLDLPSE